MTRQLCNLPAARFCTLALFGALVSCAPAPSGPLERSVPSTQPASAGSTGAIQKGTTRNGGRFVAVGQSARAEGSAAQGYLAITGGGRYEIPQRGFSGVSQITIGGRCAPSMDATLTQINPQSVLDLKTNPEAVTSLQATIDAARILASDYCSVLRGLMLKIQWRTPRTGTTQEISTTVDRSNDWRVGLPQIASTEPAQGQGGATSGKYISVYEPSPESLARARSLFARFEREAPLRAEQRLQSALASMNANRRPGVVYKSELFWQRYPNLEVPRYIFDGEIGLISSSNDFAEVYFAYVDGFYQQCRDFLPTQRAVFTSKTVNEFGARVPGTGQYRVEMRPEFGRHYERIYSRRQRGLTLDGFQSIFRAVLNRQRNEVPAVGSAILGEVAKRERLYAEMRRFFASEGCQSATVKQLERNLLNVAGGRFPIQRTGTPRIPGAERESEPFTQLDAQRWQELQWRLRALSKSPGSNGYPLMREEIEKYDHDGPRSITPRSNDAREASIAMERDGIPVIRCVYGPTGFLRDGQSFDTEEHFFIFAERPRNFDAFIAGYDGLKGVYRGRYHVVDACPGNSAQAQRLVNSAAR